MSSVSTRLIVFNASAQSMQTITSSVSHNSDWGTNKPSVNFNSISIDAFGYHKSEEDLDSDADSAHFQLNITYANGDQLVISSNQRAALSAGAQQYSLQGASAANYRCYVIAGDGQLLFAVMPNVTAQYWMKQTWDSIKTKQLCQLALPGSHDAGMHTLSASTFWSTEDNTRTQSLKIADQLNNGSRFFECRPMYWSESDDTDIYLGHFAPPGHTGVELQGSLGEKLSDVLDDIHTYITNSANSHEIVVLRFEQSRDIDRDGAEFNTTQKTALKTLVLEKLGSCLYTNHDPNCNLGYVILQDMYNDNRRVIVVFDDFSGNDSDGNPLLDASSGIFSYGDNNSSANYRLYDNFANSDDFLTMYGDQITKFFDFQSSQASMFLLSWTLSMQGTDYVDNSIADLANTANIYLWYGMFEMFKNNIVRTSKVPNIIYVDYVDSKYYLAEAAYCLNSYATGN